MAKTKKITATNIIEALGDAPADREEKLTIGDGERAIGITVKKRLSLTERASMVSSIAAMVWHKDEQNDVAFTPYLRKFACDYHIIAFFTDISLPDDMNKVWELVDRTRIVDMIIDCVGNGYIERILREANELIEYQKEEAHKRSKLDGVITAVCDAVNVIRAKTENLSTTDLLDSLQKLSPELKDEFEKLMKTQAPAVPDAVPTAPVE